MQNEYKYLVNLAGRLAGNDNGQKGVIWEIAARNNKKPLIVRRRKTDNTAYFTGC